MVKNMGEKRFNKGVEKTTSKRRAVGEVRSWLKKEQAIMRSFREELWKNGEMDDGSWVSKSVALNAKSEWLTEGRQRSVWKEWRRT